MSVEVGTDDRKSLGRSTTISSTLAKKTKIQSTMNPPSKSTIQLRWTLMSGMEVVVSPKQMRRLGNKRGERTCARVLPFTNSLNRL